MACMKLGSKADGFQRQGQAWFCASGLPSDIRIEVGEMSFHLHKFPLLSRSGRLGRLIEELSEDDQEAHVIKLNDIPGGPGAFELAAKFCYGVKAELTATNVVSLRCAAEYLEMTEEYGEGNLISLTELFLNQVVLRSWKDSLKALQSCEDIHPHAEELNIVKRLVDSLAIQACSDPNLFGWPMMEHGSMQSPGGSVLWNGISTGARPKHSSPDWWFEDATLLNLQLYKRLITAMEARGIRAENIAGSLMAYAKRYLPGLYRRQGSQEISSRFSSLTLSSATNENDQRHLLETIESLLPMQKGVTSTRFLFGLLKTAMILNANPDCKNNLEKRIGMQLDQATVEDLLMPNYSYAVENLYDVDCIQRILDHFLSFDQNAGGVSPCSVDDGHLIGSPSLTPITMVAKLMDGYLAEIATDESLKVSKYQSLAAALPDYARPLDDGLYRAIDIYLKAHPWLIDSEREQLCRLMDCQKLSLEACTHAAQNERLPLRVVVQVLFFEQLQLRTSIAGCFLVSDNLDTSRPIRHSMPISNEGAVQTSALRGENWVNAVRENQVLKVGMDNMRLRVSELEKECSNMRQEIEKLGKGKGAWNSVSKKFGFRFKSQFCTTQEGAINTQNHSTKEPEQYKSKSSRHKRNGSSKD